MADRVRVASADVVTYAEANRLDLATVQGTGNGGRITLADAQAAVAASVPYATPLVTRLAAENSVDLRVVAGTGVGGRITKDDVLRAAGKAPAGPQSLTDAAAVGDRMLQELIDTLNPGRAAASAGSMAAGSGPFGRNPLVEQERVKALAEGRPTPSGAAPTLFASGDAPAFTASGIPPEAVFEVPWQARHALASAPTPAAAYAIVTECGTGPDAADNARALYGNHDGNADYAQRVEQWVVSSMSDEALANLGTYAAQAEVNRRQQVRWGDVDGLPDAETALIDSIASSRYAGRTLS